VRNVQPGCLIEKKNPWSYERLTAAAMAAEISSLPLGSGAVWISSLEAFSAVIVDRLTPSFWRGVP
jgi:hypothetical protein